MPIKTKSIKASHAHSIEEDTSIIPEIVAEQVIQEANHLLNTDLLEDVDSDLIGYLAGYANATYANSKDFHKKINSNADRGNAGRDWLYAFMKHWLSSEILRRNPDPQIRHILTGSGFSTGR